MLKTNGVRVGRRFVAEIIRERKLVPKVVKKYKATTNLNHNLPVAQNLLLKEQIEEERMGE